MATLNVQQVTAIGFPIDTIVTAPDGNTFTALANTWFGIPSNQGHIMIVFPAGPALCMLKGSYLKKGSGDFLQLMTVDEIRTSI